MPPAYDIAAKLPTYEEAEMTKHSDSRVSQMFHTFDYYALRWIVLKNLTITTCSCTVHVLIRNIELSSILDNGRYA